MRRQNWWLLGLVLIGVGLWVTLWPSNSQAKPPAQAPETQPSIAGGRTLWPENCVPCHGSTGQGDGPTAQAIEAPLPDLTDAALARQRTPVENFEVIKNGRMDKMMPPWGNRLSDDQIWDLAAYVWSLSTTPEDISAGQIVYQEQCVACHGENGSGDGPETQTEIIDFTDLQVMSQRSQAELQAGFDAAEAHAELNQIPEAELWQALDYVRTFSFALPQRNGILSGQMINETTGQPVGNAEVTLYIFEGNTPLETLVTQADSEGQYSFTQLPTDHSLIYVVEGQYQDISYMSDFGLFTPDSNETTLDLKVYETTSDPANITLNRLNLLLSFSPEAVQIIQLFILNNEGQQTYVGQDGETFAFTLPENASNVSFQHDTGGVQEKEGGYVATAPVLPGEEGLVVASIYSLPYEEDSLEVDIPLPDDASSVTLLIQEQGASLSSEQLQFVESRERQGSTFSVYNASNIEQAQGLALELTNLDDLSFPTVPGEMPASASMPAASTSFDQNMARWVVIGLVVLAIVGAGVLYPRWRPVMVAPVEEEDAVRQQKLLLLLARLDETFEAGELDEQVYRQARARYKAELVELVERSV